MTIHCHALSWIGLLTLLCCGCRSNFWYEPRTSTIGLLAASTWADAAAIHSRSAAEGDPNCFPDFEGPGPTLEFARSCSWEAAREEDAESALATDHYYLAAMHAWRVLTHPGATEQQRDVACEIHHDSLARLLATAGENGRLVPGQGVVVHTPVGPRCIPFRMDGFAWRTGDVQRVCPVGEYNAKSLSRQYQCDGLGVPVVVQRVQPTGAYVEESFLAPGAMFAATVLLRPCTSNGGEGVLEFFNPLHPGVPQGLPPGTELAADISAPFALREISDPQLGNGWIPFLTSDTPAPEGLFFVEPYQPGKIPVVFVHGLLASPHSWVEMANDLRSIPGFTDHFQLWGFRYSTGKPFLAAAARLRQDLCRAVATVDPASGDPALRNMVLIGHSMGGLICKLQATGSENILWSAFAHVPLESIVTDPATRELLRGQFYFTPQPNVRRVIYIATPHQGSAFAQRPIGQLGSTLATSDMAQIERYEQLMADNPGAFTSEALQGIPTSIEMLDPDSEILQAIAALPRNPCVRFHSIVGYGCFNLLDGPGDGVVPLESTDEPGVVSEHEVRAFHTRVHRQLETVDEVDRILREHLAGR